MFPGTDALQPDIVLIFSCSSYKEKNPFWFILKWSSQPQPCGAPEFSHKEVDHFNLLPLPSCPLLVPEVCNCTCFRTHLISSDGNAHQTSLNNRRITTGLGNRRKDWITKLCEGQHAAGHQDTSEPGAQAHQHFPSISHLCSPHSPLDGKRGQGWFLGTHSFSRWRSNPSALWFSVQTLQRRGLACPALLGAHLQICPRGQSMESRSANMEAPLLTMHLGEEAASTKGF